MCVDISFHSDIQLTQDAFPGIVINRGQQFSSDFAEQIMAFAFPPCYVIREVDGVTEATTMEWGVLPTWIEDKKEQSARRTSMVNIQSERILEDKRSIWYRIRKNRILIPVDGIYEHREVKGMKNKVPYFVYYKESKPFYIPGLFQRFEFADEDGVVQEHYSFGLVTRKANEPMAQIHNSGNNKHRMPLFVPLEMARTWISPSAQETEMKEIMAFEVPADELGYHPVYTLRGGKTRPDGKHKYDPWDWPGLPKLGNDTSINQ